VSSGTTLESTLVVTTVGHHSKMVSPWSLFEAAASGDFGRAPRRLVLSLAAAVVVVSLVTRVPELWLIHSFATWKTHEVQHFLQGVLHQLKYPKPPAPRAPGP
jgi:hypothetical protein